MSALKMLRGGIENQKGFALISVYFAGIVIAAIAGAAYSKAFFEGRYVEREIARQRSYAAAEAGLQSAIVQINQNAYTGFINTSSINSVASNNFSDVAGRTLGVMSAVIQYPSQGDWVVITARGAVDGEERILEARVFLESNFSKYVVYANTADFASGNNAQYNSPAAGYAEGVPPDARDRAALYFKGTWSIDGTNVHLYGDANVEGSISGNTSSYVHGDVYTGNFATTGSGAVTNSGVTGGLHVGDGYSADDADRNRDGATDSRDYPDYHGLTATGSGDSHAREDQVQINNSFYQSHNNVPAFSSGSARDRHLLLSASGNSTVVTEYTSPAFTTTSGSSYTLPSSAVVYVNGNTYVKGEIAGRVTMVSSSSIYFAGTVKYQGGNTFGDTNHSAAFFSSGKMYVLPNANTSISGIFYAQNGASTTTTAFDGSYYYDSRSGRLQTTTTKPYDLRLYGNRIMNGTPGLSTYTGDGSGAARYYIYDPNLQLYRPPGIPVVPELRMVREL